MITSRPVTSKRMIPWLEAGYDLFIDKGHYAIHVELLARVLGRNKSAFYHFFKSKEIYLEFILEYQMSKVDSFVKEIKGIDEYDPHYLDLLIRHHRIILFNSQLIKNCHIKFYDTALQEINARIDECILPIWSKHVGLDHDLDLSRRYYAIIRDYMYIRLTPELFQYDFLSALASEAKLIISGLMNTRIVNFEK
jgi:AcrR family transcriptional regulator